MKEDLSSIDNSLLRRSVEDLTNQVNKMIGINMSLQSKMVELLIKMSELTEETKQMVTLLKIASTGSGAEETKPAMDAEIIAKMLEQNQRLLERMEQMEKNVKKVYRHQVLQKLQKKRQNEA